MKCGKAFRAFVGGILAGISIAVGGTVFLSLENRVLGAVFFTVGLFAVCTFGFNLYTGKICYVFDNGRDFALDLPLIWLGNLAGAFLTAVEGFRSNPHPLGKYLSLFFGVTVFILCGVEHCVANMYYFSVAGMWSWKTLAWVLVMTLGNSVGGVFFPLMRRLTAQKDRKT